MAEGQGGEPEIVKLEHLKWSVADVNKIKPNYLMDSGSWPEEGEAEGAITREELMNNPRIRSMMDQPRNRIASLPDQKAVARHFYCGICGGIPFPLASDFENDNTPSQTVTLCKNGHPICRQCSKSYSTCLFSMKDYVKVYDEPPTLEALEEHTKPVEKPLGGWGSVRVCSTTQADSKCVLLTEMILYAEFACKNFYNWCGFRGRGQELRDHVASCPHKEENGKTSEVDEEAKKESSDSSECSDKPRTSVDQDVDENETAIRHFDLEKARRRIRLMAQALKKEHGSEVDTGTIPL